MAGRTLRSAAVLGASAITLAGCGFHGIYSLPLPGAAGNGKPSYLVTAQFTDALDLVPYSTCKVNDATVGHVKSVNLVHGIASVVCTIPNTVKLPANAVASIAQTSLLGEKFVEFEPPAKGATGRLTNGAVIPVSRTDTSATVEEVLGALSLLLNGGGLNQIHTITSELNNALAGRESTARDVLNQVNTLAAGLNAQKADIVRAMEGIDNLSKTVRAQEGTITTALSTMPQAVQILADNRSQLTTLLVSLQHLGDVAVRTENASQADLVANLHSLQPVLQKLGEAGDNISKSLEVLLTFPYASGGYSKVFQGDYTNIAITLDLRPSSLLKGFGLGPDAPKGSGGGLGLPGLGSLPKLPTLPSLPKLPIPTPGQKSGTGPAPAPTTKPVLPILPSLLSPQAASMAQTVPPDTSDSAAFGSSIAALLLGVLR
jgi:phospholipid/cholesterol/gamma-HCH transport system substrate-binding protein